MFFCILIKSDSEYSHEEDEDTQATNINEMFDYALALLWPLVTKNKWDMTNLPDISEGFSYVSVFLSFLSIVFELNHTKKNGKLIRDNKIHRRQKKNRIRKKINI